MTYFNITTNGNRLVFTNRSNAEKFNTPIHETSHASAPLTDSETDRFLSYHIETPIVKLTPAQSIIVDSMKEGATLEVIQCRDDCHGASYYKLNGKVIYKGATIWALVKKGVLIYTPLVDAMALYEAGKMKSGMHIATFKLV